MSDVAQFTIAPPLRCARITSDSAPYPCARRATWTRDLGPGRLPLFLCDRCHERGDVPIAPPYVFRRVSITADVWFAGTSCAPGEAQAEAVYQLEQAIEAAGGMLSLHTVTSTLGRYSPPEPSSRGRGRPAKGLGRPVRH